MPSALLDDDITPTTTGSQGAQIGTELFEDDAQENDAFNDYAHNRDALPGDGHHRDAPIDDADHRETLPDVPRGSGVGSDIDVEGL